MEKYSESSLYISAITIEEIYDGLGYMKKEKGEEIYKKIRRQYEKILYSFEIVLLTTDIIKKTGLLRGELRKTGEILDLADLIIMISAQESKASKMIKRNPRHFKNSKVSIESY